MNIEQAIAHLREVAEEVPEPATLPTEDDVADIEEELGVKFHPDYRKFLLHASDVAFGALEPATITDADAHTHLPTIAEEAWGLDVPKKLLPICEDNGDYYCMDQKTGKITYWSGNGKSDESWPSLAVWIEEVWIGENTDEDAEDDD